MSCSINFTYLMRHKTARSRSILADIMWQITYVYHMNSTIWGILSQPPHCALGTGLANVTWHHLGFGFSNVPLLHSLSLASTATQEIYQNFIISRHTRWRAIHRFVWIHYKYMRGHEEYGLGSPSGKQVLSPRDPFQFLTKSYNGHAR